MAGSGSAVVVSCSQFVAVPVGLMMKQLLFADKAQIFPVVSAFLYSCQCVIIYSGIEYDIPLGSAQTLSNGTGPVLTGLFACSGDEASLTDCGNVPGFDASNCTAEAAVICSNQGGVLL